MPARTYLVQFTETHGDTLPPDKWRKVMASSMENACVAGLRSEPAVKALLASDSYWGWVQLTKFLHYNGTPMAVESFRVISKRKEISVKYEALLAYDVPNYATVTFESESGEAAAARCLQILAEKPNDIAFEEEFASCNGERIVSLSSETGGIVLCDIELDPDPLRDNAFTLLMAAKEAEEAARQAGIHQHPDGGDLPWYVRLKATIAACGRESADASAAH